MGVLLISRPATLVSLSFWQEVTCMYRLCENIWLDNRQPCFILGLACQQTITSVLLIHIYMTQHQYFFFLCENIWQVSSLFYFWVLDLLVNKLPQVQHPVLFLIVWNIWHLPSLFIFGTCLSTNHHQSSIFPGLQTTSTWLSSRPSSSTVLGSRVNWQHNIFKRKLWQACLWHQVQCLLSPDSSTQGLIIFKIQHCNYTTRHIFKPAEPHIYLATQRIHVNHHHSH